MIFFSFRKVYIKFHVKVISSLARVLQKAVGIRFFFIWFEVGFFNFAMNKANCDWLTLILNMAHSNQSNYQNKTINTQIVSALRSRSRRLYKYHLWYFRQHFPDTGYWECASYTNNTMPGNFIEKMWKRYCQNCHKNPY